MDVGQVRLLKDGGRKARMEDIERADKVFLKPCPFCSGKAKLEWYAGYWFAGCNDDVNPSCGVHPVTDGLESIDDAADIWNTRMR